MARTRGSGALFKQRTSRVWWIKYYRHGVPYRESTHTTDRAEAKRFLSRRLAEIATGTFAGLEVERITIAELAEGFIRDYRVTGRRSLADVEARWKLHLQTGRTCRWLGCEPHKPPITWCCCRACRQARRTWTRRLRYEQPA